MKYYITTFTLTSKEPVEMLSAAGEVLKAMLCEAGYEAFEDLDDFNKLDDAEILNDLKELNVLKTTDDISKNGFQNDFSFLAYVQKDFFSKENVDDTIKQLPFENIHINYITREAEDKNWNEAWEKEQEPTEICRQLGITIDVKQAFGTGGHNTTHMILTRLTELNAEKSLQGKSILDCGCGSGILSIAALKMGARKAVAYDIDEWSVENTKHNAKLNDAEISVMLGDSSCLDSVEEKFDFVLANINRNILLHDMPAFASHLEDGGRMILSGFYEEDASMLLEKAEGLGLRLQHKKTSSNWMMLELVR